MAKFQGREMDPTRPAPAGDASFLWVFSGYFLDFFWVLLGLWKGLLVGGQRQSARPGQPGLCALASWEVAIVRVSYAYWDFLGDWEVGIKYVK